MKLEFTLEQIQNAFHTVAAAIPTRTPKPILRNVRVQVDGDRVVLLATDTEISIRMEVPEAIVHKPGEALLPVDRFAAILRESSDERLEIEADAHAVWVRGQRSEFKLPAGNPDEFPPLPETPSQPADQVPARLMKELIRRTIFATDTETGRYAMGGVLLEREDNELTAVGTDGRRLARMQGQVESTATAGARWSAIVPTRAMHLVERLLDEVDAPIDLIVGENEIYVHTANAWMSARQVEGRFPRWREVIRKEPATVEIELCVGPLLSAVKQAAVVTDKESRSLELVFRDGTLELSCFTAEVGSSRVEIPIAYHGEELPVTLDHRFLAEFLRVLDLQKTITFSTSAVDRPAEFQTDDGYLYVIMPMERRKRPPQVATAAV